MPEYLGIEYSIIKSRRRTCTVTVGKDQKVTVRMPLTADAHVAEDMIRGHHAWILRKQEDFKRAAKNAEARGRLSGEEIKELKEEASKVIHERVGFYAPMVGVSVGNIVIKTQRTRWGSCSKAGNLNFNCLLMLAPLEVLDSVVVHELCHLKHMNHSRSFYDEVLRVYPDYRRHHKWLKDHGNELMARLP